MTQVYYNTAQLDKECKDNTDKIKILTIGEHIRKKTYGKEK